MYRSKPDRFSLCPAKLPTFILPAAGSEKETGEASLIKHKSQHLLVCVYVSVLSTPQYAQNTIQMLPHLSV